MRGEGGGDPVRPPIELSPAGSDDDTDTPSSSVDAASSAGNDDPTPPHGVAVPAAASIPASQSGD
jgi:hypothetical protein